MKKGNEYEVMITDFDFPNKGVTEIEEYRVTVKGAFVGERVRIRITKKKNGKGEGRLLEVLEPSQEEIASPFCRHFGVCGGCMYQTFPYDTQLKMKETQVRKLLDGVCGFYRWEGILPSPVPTAYRNKMEFSFGDERKDGPLALGLHRKGSFYDLVTVDDCKIVDADYNRILSCTLEHFRRRNIPYFKKMSHEGCLRHLVIRQTARQKALLINLVVSSQIGQSDKGQIPCGGGESGCDETAIPDSYLEYIKEALALDMWIQSLQALELNGKITGILLTLNDSPADVVQSDRTYLLYGEDFVYEELLGLRFRITPFSFFQTNSLGAEILYEKVRSYVGDVSGQVVFDLYSGTGTIAQILAAVAKKVVGVEIVEEAVEAAKKNAKLNRLDNCEFIAGDVLHVLDELEEPPDMIVLDPPRDGIHPKALHKIIRYGVERMVYISCKPTSLARDLVTLQAAGYQVVKACSVDMFPWTGNVETVCLLSKLNVKQHIEVELKLDEMDLTAAESKASYEEIKAYVLKHSGLKVSNLYIAQVKRKCGIIERENYNKAKAEDARQPKCPEEKERAIKEALEYFKMV